MTMRIELDPAEFTKANNDGFQIVDPPADMPVDETQCQCGNYIGFVIDEWEDRCGRTKSGLVWVPTYRTEDGTYICEDCAMEDQ